MKKLTRDQLKRITGGNDTELPGHRDAELCTTKCYTSNGSQLSCIQSIGGCMMPSSCSNASDCK